jgi:site-specific recombinase XerD
MLLGHILITLGAHMNTPLATVCADYAEHIRLECGHSKTTCKNYRNGMSRFLRWLAENGYPTPDLNCVNSLTLRRYVLHLAEGNRQARAVHSAMQPIRSLCQWLTENGQLPEDPSLKLKLPKKGAPTRHVPTDADVQALFNACDRLATPRQGALARAVLSVLCFGGLRREECCNLRVSDFDTAAGSLTVRHGKGDKARRTYICKQGIDALKEWIAVREPDCTGDWLFMYDRARRMHFRSISSLMDTVAAGAGLRDNPACHPHALRRWSASNLLKNGASIKVVQMHLGHSDVQTTCKYLFAGEDQLRAAAELTGLKASEQPKAKPEQSDRPALRVVGVRGDERPRQRRIAR